MPVPVRDPVRLLLLAVIRQAVWDARDGDADAREWLLDAATRELALALELPCWPPQLESKRVREQESKRRRHDGI